MPEEFQPVGQDEIEELLRQAQADQGAPSPPPAAAAANDDESMDQSLGADEIEALLSASQESPQTAPQAAPRASSVAVSPGQGPPAGSPGGAYNPIQGGDVDYFLRQAEQALASVDSPSPADLEGLEPFDLRDFTTPPPSQDRASIDLIRDVQLELKIELGRTQMLLNDILKLRRGSVVPLDKMAGDPVDVYVNGRLIAHGEVLVLNDNFCVRVAELLEGNAID